MRFDADIRVVVRAPFEANVDALGEPERVDGRIRDLDAHHRDLAKTDRQRRAAARKAEKQIVALKRALKAAGYEVVDSLVEEVREA